MLSKSIVNAMVDGRDGLVLKQTKTKEPLDDWNICDKREATVCVCAQPRPSVDVSGGGG